MPPAVKRYPQPHPDHCLPREVFEVLAEAADVGEAYLGSGCVGGGRRPGFARLGQRADLQSAAKQMNQALCV